MINASNLNQNSMSNSAVAGLDSDYNHSITVDVVNGKYYATLEFVGMSILGSYGYLGWLKYYAEGWTWTQYSQPQGDTIAATVLSRQKNADGSDVYDSYNTPGNDYYLPQFLDETGLYPAKMQLEIVPQAISNLNRNDGDEESGYLLSYVPLRVAVPVMGGIALSSGEQNCYMRVDWNTLSVNYLTTDKTALQTAINDAKALEKGSKSDDAWNALRSAITAASGVDSDDKADQASIDAAATALNSAIDTFKASADQMTSDPFDGKLDEGRFYIAGQKFVDASGNAIASSDAALNQSSLNIRRVDAAEGRYEVKLQTRYALPAGPVVTSVSYEAADGSDSSAKVSRKVRDDENNVGYHTVEWRIYVDDLSKQQKLTVSYMQDGAEKTQTLYIAPLAADAKAGSMMDVFSGTADYYGSSNFLDATGLFIVIDDAKAIEQGKKSDEAYQTLQDAITAAEEVYNNTSKQQAQCDSAVETLNAAVEAFNSSADQVQTYGMEAGVWYTNSTEKWSGTKQGIGGYTPFDNQNALYKLNDDGTFTVRVKTYGKLFKVDQVAYGDDKIDATKTGQWNQGLGYKGPDTMWDFTVSDLSQVTAYVTGAYQNGTSLSAEPFTLAIDGLSQGGDYGFTKAASQLDDGALYQAWAYGKALARDESKLDAYQQLQSALSAAEGIRSAVKQGKDTYTQADIDAATARVNEAIAAYEAPVADPTFGLEVGVFYNRTRLNDSVADANGTSVKSDGPISLGKTTFRLNDDKTFEVTLALPEVSGNSGSTVESVELSSTDDASTAKAATQIGGGAGVAQFRADVASLENGFYAWITYTDAAGVKHENSKFQVKLDFSAEDGYGFTKLANQDDTRKDLYAQIVAAQNVEQGNKTTAAWNTLQEAIRAAQDVYKQDNAAEGVYTSAATTLASAVEEFNKSAEGPTIEKDTRYGLVIGSVYELSSPSSNLVVVGAAKNKLSSANFHYIARADGTYDIDLYAWSADIESVKYSTSNNLSGASAAVKTGDHNWRINVPNIAGVAYAWITYTDADGVLHEDEQVTISHSNLANKSFRDMNQLDKGLLYAAYHAADDIEYGSKPEGIWVSFCEARDAASTLLRNSSGKEQSDIDAARDAMNEAAEAYRNAADDPNGGKYGLEAGAWYTNWKARLTDADGNKLLAGDEQNPFVYGSDYYGIEVDGSAFVIQMCGIDKDGENSIASVKWSQADDESTAKDATKVSGRVGSYSPGPANWQLDGVEDLTKPVYLWVTYTDQQGVVHENAKFVKSLYGLGASATHAFVKTSRSVDSSALYKALKQAEAIEKDATKSDLAWVTFDLIRETNYVYYANKADGDTQENIDVATQQVLDAIEAYKNSESNDALDFANLSDGTYTVNVEMRKVDNRDSLSMSNEAINHEVELTVENGEYYLTFDFQGLKYLDKDGYLGNLKYYDEGYTYGKYGSPEGDLVDATVITTQKDAEGNDVYDGFNTPGSADKNFEGLYPDKVRIKYVPTARNDADGYIPLQVFVPVMESIQEGNGTQDVLAKVDKSSVKKVADQGDSVNKNDLQAKVTAANSALAGSKKNVDANEALKTAMDEAAKVLDKADATQEEVDAAADALQKAIDKFNSQPDAIVVNKSELANAIKAAEGVTRDNKTDSAWDALQDAISKAKRVNSDANATQADVNAATSALNEAVKTFKASADKADETLDFSNLPAGTYSINIDMYKMNRKDKSMSDAAINHKAKLTVDANGDYWITFDFASVKSGTTNGYLGSLSYYDEGYTYSGATVNGTVVAGTVVDYQTGVDGKQYPNRVTVKFVKTARNDADHFIPLQVFVPVMEEIAADCGKQDVLVKYDPSSIQKLDGEIPDQTIPGVNGDGNNGADNGNGGNNGGATITAPSKVTASKSGVTAATANGVTAAKSASLAAKTGDSAKQIVTLALAGFGGLAAAAYAAMRRRFGKQEGEE